MTNRELVLEYLRCFCAGDIDGLVQLLADDLRFAGPFHTFHAAGEYLASLRNDPPEPAGYELLSVTGDEDSVAVFYNYEKPDRTVQVAQLSKLSNGKITEILLIFDGRGFA